MIDDTHSKGQQGRTKTTISWLSFRLYGSAMVSYDVEVMGSLANPGKTICGYFEGGPSAWVSSQVL
jgi:hypothetical protein